jgi:hypothetical protein
MLNLTKAPTRTPDAIEDPSRQTQLAAPSADVSSTEVLITEHEVLFSTAAAVRLRREKVSHRLVAMLRRTAAALTDASSHPPRLYYLPRREPYYFEHARMARAMDRL